ncbi:MAG: hypothetical protein AAFV77_06150 [Planctomycetota bacterium]
MRGWLSDVVKLLTGFDVDEASVRSAWRPQTVADGPAAIEWLGKITGGNDADLATHVAELMRGVPGASWIALDRNLRSPWVTPATTRRLAKHPPDVAVELLGIATMSQDGYTRQAALGLLAESGHARAVPYVLLRLADWVRPVREEAMRTLRALLKGETPEVVGALLDHHDLIERLPRIERVDLRDVRDEIVAFLRSADVRNAVLAGLDPSGPSRRRRFCFDVLGDLVIADDRLLQMAIGDHDPPVRVLLARELAARPETLTDDLLDRLLGDHASTVATTMIRSLPRTTLLEHRQALQECAVADSRSVREAARFVLRDLDGFDPAASARMLMQRTAAERVRPGWVATLGELGVAKDSGAVVPFLSSRRARVRESALFALGRLSPKAVVPYASAKLRDASGRVRRMAGSILTRSPNDQWLRGVADVLRDGDGPARASAISVLSTLPGWEPVPMLLDGLLDDDELVRRRAWQNIDSWQQRYGTMGWVTPSSECSDAIQQRWPRLAGVGEVPDFASRSWDALLIRLEPLVG